MRLAITMLTIATISLVGCDQAPRNNQKSTGTTYSSGSYQAVTPPPISVRQWEPDSSASVSPPPSLPDNIQHAPAMIASPSGPIAHLGGGDYATPQGPWIHMGNGDYATPHGPVIHMGGGDYATPQGPWIHMGGGDYATPSGPVINMGGGMYATPSGPVMVLD
jgi:anti-sigma factor RsiW